MFADAHGGELVDADSVLDVCACGLAGVCAGEVAGGGAGVIARSIAEGAASVVRETGDQSEFVFVFFERREDAGDLKVFALGLGSPVGHVDAIGDVDEGEAGGALRVGGRCHGVEHGETD